MEALLQAQGIIATDIKPGPSDNTTNILPSRSGIEETSNRASHSQRTASKRSRGDIEDDEEDVKPAVSVLGHDGANSDEDIEVLEVCASPP